MVPRHRQEAVLQLIAPTGITRSKKTPRASAPFSDPRIWEATISVVCERNEGMPTRNDYQVALAEDFSSLLVAQGYNTRVFDPAGQDDIGGGCGQLWYVQEKMEDFAREGLAKPSAGFGKSIRHTPSVAEAL